MFPLRYKISGYVVNLFSSAVEQIKQKQRSAKIRLEREQSQRQGRGRGLGC